jgi:hypothetical protein
LASARKSRQNAPPLGGAFLVFFGAVGPLIARFFLRSDISKEELVATKAACQWAGHLVKIPLF